MDNGVGQESIEFHKLLVKSIKMNPYFDNNNNNTNCICLSIYLFIYLFINDLCIMREFLVDIQRHA